MINYIIFFLLMVETVVILIMFHKYHIYKMHMNEQSKWHQMAYTDDLTKIPNRAAYNRHISKLQDSIGKADKKSGIILFDIDDFKEINDTHGHLTGDKTLQSVAEMLTNTFSKANYSVYRIGGDEFAVIAENITDEDIIHLLLVIKKLEATTYNIRLSKGYALFANKDNFRDAFSQADEMLYADKASKKKKSLQY